MTFCLSACLSVGLSVCLTVGLTVYLTVCLFLHSSGFKVMQATKQMLRWLLKDVVDDKRWKPVGHSASKAFHRLPLTVWSIWGGGHHPMKTQKSVPNPEALRALTDSRRQEGQRERTFPIVPLFPDFFPFFLIFSLFFPIFAVKGALCPLDPPVATPLSKPPSPELT